MPATIIEKIVASHAGRDVRPGDMVDIRIDARIARDFGGANVVKKLVDHDLGVEDPSRTFFTFDCNPGGSDQGYASNQQACRVFARRHGVRVFDIDAGIGTHVAIDQGLVGPGGTLVSTDSHANILGAVGALGQGMGDQDVAHAFAYGTTWFVVPPTIRITLAGTPSAFATPKDVTLALVRHFGANGLLGAAAELRGAWVDELDLPGRMTIASMATEMGGIIILLTPNAAVLRHCEAARRRFAGETGTAPPADRPALADPDAEYHGDVALDIQDLQPLVSRPGHPDDVVPVAAVEGTPVDSVFIGSCTNGRYEDFVAAARVLAGRRTAPGVVLKVVPATDGVWRRLLRDGLLQVFKDAGALISNPGCAGCAAGQVGQNGPGEVTVSTGNRNFAGKQGKGDVYLASPETAAASAVAGVLVSAGRMDSVARRPAAAGARPAAGAASPRPGPGPAPESDRAPGAFGAPPTRLRGRAWVVDVDNVDTDMIFHNRYLTITDRERMGAHTFDNLPGWEDFASRAEPGDIVVAGSNFGCGSSRQQAVDCFLSLGIAAVVAGSFGAIYERNAINAGLAITTAPAAAATIADGEEIEVDLCEGWIRRSDGTLIAARPFSEAQLRIYRRGGLLASV